ncbi:MAG TPA: ATP-binding protein [Candidatus Saccharimonadia bacterium]|jgi:PAS domain S-box-containing protein
MPDQRSRNLTILARAQAVISGLVAVAIFAIYGAQPSLLTQTSTSFAAAILGVIGAVYFLTLHQILSRTRLAMSTLILSIITSINVILVIAATGGLDSPYYSLWLLAIVAAGTFGSVETLGVLGLTIVYYAFSIISEGMHAPYIRDHLVQLGITLIAGALAEWVHGRSRKAATASTRLETLSGQLSAEQLKAEAVIQGIGEGVMVIDANRKIQLLNKAAQELCGWDEASALSLDYNLVLQLKTSEDQVVTPDKDPFDEAWKKDKSIMHDDLIMTTRAGRKIQIGLSVSPIFNADHQPGGAIALFRDITKEKAVEREKEEFVSTASHEMRTPVAAIEGYLSLAMNPNVATIDERAQKYLGKAHEAIQHLGDLFRDLLSVTKADAGNLSDHTEAVNIAALLQGATDDMQFVAQKKSLTLVYQIGGQSGKAIAPLYFVAANPERLREVVMNLIDNAIKFTSEGGIKVVIEGDEKEVTVGVSDTGPGIAQEDLPHLFQKFYRVDSSATRTIGGTGLGLYLSRKIIEAFSGRIWIDSKVGQGTTIRFSLPRLTEDDVARMQAAAKPVTGTTQGTTNTPVEPSAPSQPDGPRPAAIPMPVPEDHLVSQSAQRRVQ